MPALTPVSTSTADLSLAEDAFTPSNGQTVFTLSQAAKFGGFNIFSVNGVVYREQTHYTVSGTTLTWLNSIFLTESDDQILFKYEEA